MSSEINDINNINENDWLDKKKDWQNWTKEIWEDFLKFECDRNKKDYIRNPKRLIQDYQIETSTAEDYIGRELFELIQNADDAGKECPKPNQMLIELTDALSIANTGIPFEPEGIESLMMSNISPKKFHSNLIGNKGLGFRAILGWASSIIIRSQNLSVGFSTDIAEKMFLELKNESDSIKKQTQIFVDNHEIPIAILSVPYIPEVDKFNSEKEAKVYKNINEYVGKFDTIIGLIFNEQKTIDDIQTKIKNFDDKTFLFLNHLKKIEFKSPESNKTLEVIREKDNVKFIGSESWKIFDSGEILLDIEQNKEKRKYQIKLAFCDNKEINNNDIIEERKLFVYLPTDVNFPFHFIAHATFELTSNRKHLSGGSINECIAKKLAEFIVNTANYNIKDIGNPWKALIFVTPQDIKTIESQTDLEEIGFRKELISAVSSHDIEIIPNLNGVFKYKEKLKWLDANFNDLLKGDQFEDVCLYREQDYIKKFLQDNIQIKTILYMELRKKINEFLKEKPPTINDRAEIIFRLINNWGTINENLNDAYLFSWDKIPGNDSKRLIDFLKKRFGIENVKKEKIENDKTIRVSTEQNVILLKLNDKKTKLYIEIDDGRTDELIAKTENNKLNIYKNANPPELLIDQNDIPITCEDILLPPDGEPFKLEPWVPLGIVKSELITELNEKKGFNLSRFKRIFNIEDYNIKKVIASIIKGTEDLIKMEKKTNDRELFHIQNMLREIWKIYIRKLPKDKEKYDRKKPELPIRGGGFRPADEIYLGIEYPDGKLLENLYGILKKEPRPFVENKDILSLDGSDKEIQDFLVWLGVNKEPKLIKIPNFSKYPYSSFLDHVLDKLFSDKEHLIFDHENTSKSVNKNQLKNSPNKFEIQTIDRLEDLIDNAYPELIIAWISKDERFHKEKYKAKLSGNFFGSALYTRNEDLPFYPLWRLRNEKWMLMENGNKQKPLLCTLENFSHEISKIIESPKINYEHNIFEALKIEKNEVNKALELAGVVNSLKDISWDSFYKILKKLPEEDKNGEIAKQVYECLDKKIKNLHSDSEPSGEEYDLFMKGGKLWGRNKIKEDKFKDCYCDFSKLKYLDNTNIPKYISNLVPYVHLNDSLGVENVKKCLGIESFDISKTKIQNNFKKDLSEEICEEFQKEIENLKPFALCLAENIKPISEDIIRDLKNLNVKLCSEFTGSICIDNEVKEFRLQANEYITISENTSEINVYIVADNLPDQPTKDPIISKILEGIFSDILNEKINNIRLLIICDNDQRLEYLNTIIKNGEIRLEGAKDKLYTGDVIGSKGKIYPEQPPDDKTDIAKPEPIYGHSASQKKRVNDGGRWIHLPVSEVSQNIRIPLEEIPKNNREKPKITNTPSDEDNHNKIPPQPPDIISKGYKKQIGKWGEEYIVNIVLKDDLKKRYPGKLEETVNGFRISTNDKKIEVVWHNKKRESKKDHDIMINEDDNTKYIEVKTTITDPNEMKSFDISKDEWKFAEDNKEKYHIYRVYNAGKKDVKYTIISNPYEHMELTVEPNGYTITI